VNQVKPEIPPLLEQRRPFSPLIPFLFLGLLSGMVFLPWLHQRGFQLPPCPWRQIDLARAAAWNPLFFAVCAGICASFLRWAAERAGLLPPLRWQFSRWTIGLLIAGAILNWLYLLLTLPR
jgi:hypothetical protein